MDEEQGLQQAIGPMVKMLREFKQSDETIVERIVKELGVSKEEVEKYL